MMSEALAAGLRALAARRALRRASAVNPPGAEPPASAPSGAPPLGELGRAAAGGASTFLSRAGESLLEIPGAQLLEVEGASLFTVRREVAELLPDRDLAAALRAALEELRSRPAREIDPGLRPAAGSALDELAVLDLETTGFWGCPIFLVGLLWVEEGCLVTRQLLSRDYPEEPLLLRAASELLTRRGLLVTFNGKSYDLPCLRERAITHGFGALAGRVGELAHVDVLHPARRRFAERLPDCRLQTLERRIVGIHRTGDVPSAEVPAIYHRFAATGEAQLLRTVLHHGRVDLLTTASLFARLATDGEVSR